MELNLMTTIVMSALTFTGGQINKVVNDRIDTRQQRVELMKDLCFRQHRCDALEAYLMPEIDTSPLDGVDLYPEDLE